MPSLTEKINADLKSAMLKKDNVTLSALRMLKSAIMNAQINKKQDALPDADVLALITKQVKQRADSIDQYKKGDRNDLVQKEEAEIKVFEKYMPSQLSDAELEKKIKDAIGPSNIQSKKEFGKAMGICQKAISGQADNKRISAVLNKLLS